MKKVTSVITIFLANLVGVLVMGLLAILATAKIASAACSTGGITCTSSYCTSGTISGGTQNGKTSCGITYSGGSVPITLANNVYQLEVWGAAGGDVGYVGTNNPGGKGGYSVGNRVNDTSGTVYIYVGGQGTYCMDNMFFHANGGYNGGGYGENTDANDGCGGGGGGGTDIRTTQNTTYANRVIVAGGGGGAGAVLSNTQIMLPGDNFGGGNTGGNGSITYANYPVDMTGNYLGTENGKGGTQTTGGAGGTHGSEFAGSGSLGRGGEGSSRGSYNAYIAGGGGGYYGGGSSLGARNGGAGDGGGGSGYIGGVTSGSTIAGNASQPQGSGFTASTTQTGQSGNGYARITLVSTRPTITVSAAQTFNDGGITTILNNSYVKNGNKLYISGTITDPDAQNFTVSYSLSSNTTPGAWTVCRSASSTSTYSVVG